MLEFNIASLSCGHCARAVTEAVHEVDPEARVDVDLASKHVSVQSQAELQEIESQLEEAGVEFEVRQFVRGLEPAEDLIEIATETSAELIVIGLRRRTPLGKLILGSNAQQVLLDSKCPVLAVKAAK